MKNKLLISALLVSATAVNAGQIIAPGVTLESERTWTTGKGEGFVVNHNENFLSGAFVTAQARSVYGSRQENVQLSGDHSVSLNNTSSYSERYTTKFDLCSNTSCVHQSRTFSIEANHNYTTTATTYLTTTYQQIGTYDIEATTNISGDVNATDTGRATATITR